MPRLPPKCRWRGRTVTYRITRDGKATQHPLLDENGARILLGEKNIRARAEKAIARVLLDKAEVQARIYRGEPVESYTFDAACTDWIRDELHTKDSQTDLTRVGRLIEYFGANTEPTRIDFAGIIDYDRWRREVDGPSRGQTVRAQTLRKEHQLLKRIIAYAVRRNKLPRGHTLDLPRMQSDRACDKRSGTRVSPADILRVIEALRNAETRDYARLVWEMGLRGTVPSVLTPRMVEWGAARQAHGRLNVPAEAHKIGRHTDKPFRPFIVSDVAADILRRRCAGRGPDELIFSVTAHAVARALANKSDELGLPRITRRDMRHTALSEWCDRAGGNFAGVLVLTGQKLVSTLTDHYWHPDESQAETIALTRGDISGDPSKSAGPKS